MGDDFPDRDKIPLPNKIFKDNETLSIEGVTIETKELGPGETDNATAYYLPATKELFTGDIVLYNMHLFFIENHLDELVAILNRLPRLYPNSKTVYPGHGEKTTLKAAVKDQLGYIKTFRKLVAAELAKNKSISPEAKTRIAEQVKKMYPERGFPAGQPDLLELDVDGMARAIQASGGKNQ